MLRRLQKGVKYALRLRKDHHCVHVEGPPFEGFYTRIQGHDRSTLAIVFCWVKDAKIRPNFLHVSYTPIASNSPIKHFKVEIFPESLEKILLSDHEADKKTIGAERAESFGDNRDLLQPFCLRIPPLRTKDTHAHSSDTNATQRQTRSEDAEVTQMGARRGDTDATHMQAHSGDADADATQMRARRGDADAVPLRSDGATSAADVLAMTSGEYVIGKHAQRYVVRFPHPEDGAQMHLEVDLTDRCAWNEPHNSDSVEQVGSEKKEEKEVIRAGMGSPADFLAGPEGGLVRLNKLLPLHWYVFSTRSKAKYTLSRDGHEILRNEGWAHQEKNWGNSFPTGWIWSHGVSPDAATYFSLAGGSILGISAYLIGFRSKKIRLGFQASHHHESLSFLHASDAR